jgi:Xaa-Pro aminopeptidase
LLNSLDPKARSYPEGDTFLLTNPIHLMYLANFWVDPFSLGAGFGGLLLLRKDGHTTLIHGNHLPASAKKAHADECRVVDWYDAQSPARCPRELAPLLGLPNHERHFRIHDRLGDPYAPTLVGTLAQLRRRKDADEIALLRRCMKVTEAGHAWARTHLRPGMTELDVYRGVNSVCIETAGQPIIIYGDFAVTTNPVRIGGPPTGRILKPGDLFILDYSVVIGGYRSDFTNTFAVGNQPTPEQHRLFSLCQEAMAAGEKKLRAGARCRDVYDAVRGVFEQAGMADHFPHHAGHGLGLSHPETPFLVRHATETLEAGDVVTLEPGLYVDGVGGVRIENNYLIQETGFDCLSPHVIALCS